MPGHRSKKRIGTFQKKGRPMKQNSSNTCSLDESSVVSDKSTNTDSISTAERSTMTTNSSLSVEKGTDTSLIDAETDSDATSDFSSFISHANLTLPSTDWFIKCIPGEVVRVFHIQHQETTCSLSMPVLVSRCLIVYRDYTWTCKVNGITLPTTSSVCSSLSDTICLSDFSSLLSSLKTSYVCPGNDDSHFVEFCKTKRGQFLSVKKTVVAFLDQFNGNSPTVRHISCDLLVTNEKRSYVASYRGVLVSDSYPVTGYHGYHGYLCFILCHQFPGCLGWPDQVLGLLQLSERS